MTLCNTEGEEYLGSDQSLNFKVCRILHLSLFLADTYINFYISISGYVWKKYAIVDLANGAMGLVRISRRVSVSLNITMSCDIFGTFTCNNLDIILRCCAS